MSQSDYSNTVKFPSPIELIGLAAAFLPFACKYSTESTQTVNGVVVEHSKTDYAAIILGAIAIVIGLYIAATLLNRTDDNDRWKRYAVVAAIILVGAFQVVGRGFGMV